MYRTDVLLYQTALRGLFSDGLARQVKLNEPN
jgi:hypothetical protein